MRKRKISNAEEQLNAESLVWLFAEVLKERVEPEELRCDDNGSFSYSLSEIAECDETSREDAFAALTFTNGLLACAAYRPSTFINYLK